MEYFDTAESGQDRPGSLQRSEATNERLRLGDDIPVCAGQAPYHHSGNVGFVKCSSRSEYE
jgi:hypothetical protein